MNCQMLFIAALIFGAIISLSARHFSGSSGYHLSISVERHSRSSSEDFQHQPPFLMEPIAIKLPNQHHHHHHKVVQQPPPQQHKRRHRKFYIRCVLNSTNTAICVSSRRGCLINYGERQQPIDGGFNSKFECQLYHELPDAVACFDPATNGYSCVTANSTCCQPPKIVAKQFLADLANPDALFMCTMVIFAPSKVRCQSTINKMTTSCRPGGIGCFENEVQLLGSAATEKYFVIPSHVNWYQAKVTCAAYGAQLASITTADDQIALTSLATSAGADSASCVVPLVGYWTGARARANSTSYYWDMDEQLATMTNWDGPTQPDFKGCRPDGVETCARILKNGKLDDLMCLEITEGVICQNPNGSCPA